MRKYAVADKVMGAVYFDVVDVFVTAVFYGDDPVPEDVIIANVAGRLIVYSL